MTTDHWLAVIPSWIGTLTTLLVLLIGAIVRLFLAIKKTDARIDVLEERDRQQHEASMAMIAELKADIADQQQSRREVWTRLDTICDQIARMGADISYMRGRSNGIASNDRGG
jgi:uncharacterized coiled-coil protein SlyX